MRLKCFSCFPLELGVKRQFYDLHIVSFYFDLSISCIMTIKTNLYKMTSRGEFDQFIEDSTATPQKVPIYKNASV